VTPAERLPCIHGCGRFFGGDETLRRHRFGDRCLSDRELRRRGMTLDAFGTWRRVVPVKVPTQASLIDRRTVGRVNKGLRQKRRNATQAHVRGGLASEGAETRSAVPGTAGGLR